MQADPLQQLRDVHLPAQPGWWPPAPGWWIAFLIAVALAGWFGWQLWQRHLRLRPFRIAQQLHQQLCSDLASGDISQQQYLHDANALLKRTFIHGRHDRSSSALAGQDWLEFLNGYVPGTPFTGAPGQLLTQTRFTAAESFSTQTITQLQQHIGAALTQAAKP